MLAVIVFAVQNPERVSVRFLDWNLELSKITLVFCALFVGGFIMNLWKEIETIVGTRRMSRDYASRIAELEIEVRARDERIVGLEQDLKARGPEPASSASEESKPGQETGDPV